MAEPNPTLWDYEDVAAYLKVSPKTVERWANERRLPVVKVGVLNRFDPDDIREYAARHKIPAGAIEEGEPDG